MKAACKCGNDPQNPHECVDCGHDDDGEERYAKYDEMTIITCKVLCNKAFPSVDVHFGLEWKGECYCSYVQ